MEILIPLDPDQMMDIYLSLKQETGKTSVGRVAYRLATLGVTSPRTHKPYSRQNVWLALIQSSRASQVLPQHHKLLCGRKLMGND